jgi:hypothetical protein
MLASTLRQLRDLWVIQREPRGARLLQMLEAMLMTQPTPGAVLKMGSPHLLEMRALEPKNDAQLQRLVGPQGFETIEWYRTGLERAASVAAVTERLGLRFGTGFAIRAADPVQKQVVVNEHAQVFRGMPFKRVFYRLLGGDLGVPLESLGQEEEPGATRLSIPTPVIHAGREFELLVVPTPPTGRIVGTLVLQRLREDGTPAAPSEEMSTTSYEGPRLSRLRLLMPPVSRAGLYELLFKGAPVDSEPLRFAVVSLAE